MTKEALYTLLLGWILGLLSPIILKRIDENKKKKEILKGIYSELNEFNTIFAILRYQLESKFNTVNHELIDEVLPILENSESVKGVESTVEILKSWSNLSESELREVDSNLTKGGSLSLRNYRLSFLKSKFSELSTIDYKLQKELFDIDFNFELYNSEVNDSIYFFRMTFNYEVSEENHKIIKENLLLSYESVSSRTNVILKKIEIAKKNINKLLY